jgi:hypothetical protein
MRSPWGRRAVAAAVGTALLGGCAIHPLPGDFSRTSTYEIVEKIRCEAAGALREAKLDQDFLMKAYIGLDFDFNITETNNAGTLLAPGSLTFTDLSNDSTVSVSGAAERQRTAQRKFRIVETLDKLSTADCSPQTVRANWLHPITGSIGMHEVVRSYVGLEKLTTFAKHDSPSDQFGDTVSALPMVFSDVLRFQTTLSAGVKPELRLSAPGIGSFHLTGASIFGSAVRADDHKLTVVLARDPKVDIEDEDTLESLSGGGTRSKGLKDPKLMAIVRRSDKLSALHARDPAAALRVARGIAARQSQKRDDMKRKEDELLNTLRSGQLANQAHGPSSLLRTAAPLGSVGYGPTTFSSARMVEALSLKGQYGKTLVYLELERRRSDEEEDLYLSRVGEIIRSLKPGP